MGKRDGRMGLQDAHVSSGSREGEGNNWTPDDNRGRVCLLASLPSLGTLVPSRSPFLAGFTWVKWFRLLSTYYMLGTELSATCSSANL